MEWNNYICIYFVLFKSNIFNIRNCICILNVFILLCVLIYIKFFSKFILLV